MKVYQIGGVKFVLESLTYQQKKLATPFERKLREMFLALAQVQTPKSGSGPEATQKAVSEGLSTLMSLTFNLEDVLFGDDSLLIFLATILTRLDERDKPEVWTEKAIEENRSTLLYIREEQIGEIIQDFFNRSKKSIPGSTLAFVDSSTLNAQSTERSN